MNLNKLSSDEVPGKFSEWVLAMGCPPEKVPNVDLIAQMCRGQFYMVWRSLMENVEPKNEIKYKRLLVFSDDIRNYKEKKDNNALVPNELELWKQHEDIKQKVRTADERMETTQKDIQCLMDKISKKLSQRNLLRCRVSDAQRRLWLLQKVTDDLRKKKSDLQEAMSIASTLCCPEVRDNIESKLDKYMRLVCPGSELGTSISSVSTFSTLSSIANATSHSMKSHTDDDMEENLHSLAKCAGDKLWPLLCERRAGLCVALNTDKMRQSTKQTKTTTPQSVLSHTAALHCTIALTAMKNKVHIGRTKKILASAITNLNMYPNGDAYEHLVVCCEQIRGQARVNALKLSLDELTNRRGIFEANRPHGDRNSTKNMISLMDKSILKKKEKLKTVLLSLEITQRKTESMKDCLKLIFKRLQDVKVFDELDNYRGHLPVSQESLSPLKDFYEEKRKRNEKKLNLSLDLDVSTNSLSDITAAKDGAQFIDELKLYLDSFCLENNRKLVLDRGEKIWIFETLQSRLHRLFTKWQCEDVTGVLCPSVSLVLNMRNIIDGIQNKEDMSCVLKELETRKERVYDSIDITQITDEDKHVTDRIKKRLNCNLLNLEKMSRTLNVGFEHLEFWSKNGLKAYINKNRRVNGKTYTEYEKYYLECINI